MYIWKPSSLVNKSFGAHRKRSGIHGFSLVELSIVMLFSLIALSVLAVIFETIDEVRAQDQIRMDLSQATRIAADRMTAELSLAKSFSLCSDTSIEFVADMGSGDQTIRYYYYDPSNDRRPPFYLYRAISYSSAGDGQPLLTLMDYSWSALRPTAPSTPRIRFNYYNSSGTSMSKPLSSANRALVKTIGVTLTVENVEEGFEPPEPHVQILRRFKVTPRMLR